MSGVSGDFSKLERLAKGLRGLPAAMKAAAPRIGERVSAIEDAHMRGPREGEGGGRTPGEWPAPWTDAATEELERVVAAELGAEVK